MKSGLADKVLCPLVDSILKNYRGLFLEKA